MVRTFAFYEVTELQVRGIPRQFVTLIHAPNLQEPEFLGQFSSDCDRMDEMIALHAKNRGYEEYCVQGNDVELRYFDLTNGSVSNAENFPTRWMWDEGATPAKINHALDHPDWLVRLEAVNHPLADINLLAKKVWDNSDTKTVREAAAIALAARRHRERTMTEMPIPFEAMSFAGIDGRALVSNYTSISIDVIENEEAELFSVSLHKSVEDCGILSGEAVAEFEFYEDAIEYAETLQQFMNLGRAECFASLVEIDNKYLLMQLQGETYGN